MKTKRYFFVFLIIFLFFMSYGSARTRYIFEMNQCAYDATVMHLNIESNLHEKVYLNISSVPKENHSLIIKPGRHYVISSDKI